MALFKKKEGVPNIPTSSSLPPLPSLPLLPSITPEPIKRDLPELPSFPTSPKNENLNQAMVKSAVSDMPSPDEKEMYMRAPESLLPTGEPIAKPIIPQNPIMQSSIPEPPRSIVPSRPQEVGLHSPTAPIVPTHLPNAPTKEARPNEPIFVRIDKFQLAQKNFEEIKSKMTEMEEVLGKIKEVKSQEEEELKGWTEDVEKLKIRLAEIDNDIFSRL